MSTLYDKNQYIQILLFIFRIWNENFTQIGPDCTGFVLYTLNVKKLLATMCCETLLQ